MKQAMLIAGVVLALNSGAARSDTGIIGGPVPAAPPSHWPTWPPAPPPPHRPFLPPGPVNPGGPILISCTVNVGCVATPE